MLEISTGIISPSRSAGSYKAEKSEFQFSNQRTKFQYHVSIVIFCAKPVARLCFKEVCLVGTFQRYNIMFIFFLFAIGKSYCDILTAFLNKHCLIKAP